MSKNKGLALELTSLLDVIMIMLFWVMTNSSSSAAKAEEKADQKVKNAQTKVESAEKKLDEQAKEYEQKIEDLKAQAYDQQKALNDEAAMNQKAINDYKDGLLITLNIRNENGKDKLTLARGSSQIAEYSITDGLYDELDLALASMGISDDNAAMAAVIYDGDAVLYNDLSTIREIVSKLSQSHKSVYFTYINTSK